MGAYNSKPVTDKHSVCGTSEYLTYAASSMQGWRMQQEDAHNCLPDFDPDRLASLFAVYDGHGGSEVARYCAARLPGFLKELSAYKELDPSKALRQLFLDFDASLAMPETRASLQAMTEKGSDDTDKADQKSQSENTDDDETEPDETGELTALQAEAEQPLESVLVQYGGEKALPPSIKTLLDARRERCQDASEDAPSTSKQPHKENSDELLVESSDKQPKSSERVDNSETFETEQEKSYKAEDQVIVDAELAGTEDKLNRAENGNGDDEDDSSDDSVSLEELEDEDDDDDEEDDSEDTEGTSNKEDNGYEDDDDEEQLPLRIPFPDQDDCEPGIDSGTTACVALVAPMENGLVRLFVANAGDSRAVLCRGGAAVDLSVDHKPEDEDEKSRIIAAGGTVTRDGRVNGGLNLSRALGDHSYKQVRELPLSEQMITPLPDVSQFDLVPGADEFMVLACDGVWNSMTSQEVVNFVYDRLHPSSDGSVDSTSAGDSNHAKKTSHDPAKLKQICEEIFDFCLAPSTEGDGTGCDNMTCIIVCFDDLPELSRKWMALQSNNQDQTDPFDKKRVHKIGHDNDPLSIPKRARQDNEIHPSVNSRVTVANGNNT